MARRLPRRCGPQPPQSGIARCVSSRVRERLARTLAAYFLFRSNPRVAVLTNSGVASSGEATAIAFRERPGAHSFGTPTYGLSTANRGFGLTGGGTLTLCVSTMADRTGRRYGNALPPDEVIADPSETVRRAIEWLRQ